MSEDPILRRRAQVARLVAAGQRVGYTLFLVACAGVLVYFLAGQPEWALPLVIGSLLTGSVVLAPAIIFGYAVKAADREDRERRERRSASGTQPGQ